MQCDAHFLAADVAAPLALLPVAAVPVFAVPVFVARGVAVPIAAVPGVAVPGVAAPVFVVPGVAARDAPVPFGVPVAPDVLVLPERPVVVALLVVAFAVRGAGDATSVVVRTLGAVAVLLVSVAAAEAAKCAAPIPTRKTAAGVAVASEPAAAAAVDVQLGRPYGALPAVVAAAGPLVVADTGAVAGLWYAAVAG